MINYHDWLIQEGKCTDIELDKAGGVIPQKMGAAKKGDLITLPESVSGTNCFNCKWVKKHGKTGDCTHPKINQCVNERNCCAYWDHSRAIRHFED